MKRARLGIKEWSYDFQQETVFATYLELKCLFLPEEFANAGTLKVTMLKLNQERIMKTMTCNQLGGACEEAFRASTFEEVAEMSKKHCMEMFQLNDQPHLNAMGEMQTLMKEQDDMQKWFEDRRKEFVELPES